MTLALVIVILAALCTYLYRRTPPPSIPVTLPVAPQAVASPPSAPSAPIEKSARTALPAENRGPLATFREERKRPGRIRGRVVFPDSDRSAKQFSYQIYLFGADGSLDGPRTIANSARFSIASVTPGRKAVFFLSPTELLTCPYQIAVVPEDGEAEVELIPRKCHALEGKLVDANGSPVGGLYVTAVEIVTLPQELYLEGKPASVSPLEIALTSAGRTVPIAENPTEIPVQILRVHPGEGRVSRGTIASSQGKFSIPLSSLETAVPLVVSRGPFELLKEEVVAPTTGPARIILPLQ